MLVYTCVCVCVCVCVSLRDSLYMFTSFCGPAGYPWQSLPGGLQLRRVPCGESPPFGDVSVGERNPPALPPPATGHLVESQKYCTHTHTQEKTLHAEGSCLAQHEFVVTTAQTHSMCGGRSVREVQPNLQPGRKLRCAVRPRAVVKGLRLPKEGKELVASPLLPGEGGSGGVCELSTGDEELGAGDATQVSRC